jgi:hypothetical protein
MLGGGQQRFTALKSKIFRLRELFERQLALTQESDDFESQDQLDQQGIYVKQTIKDS